MYVADVKHIKSRISKKAEAIPQVWKCPCDAKDCPTAVVYARAADGTVWFQCTASFVHDGFKIIFGIDNVEDINMMLADERIEANDRIMLGLLLHMGLLPILLEA